jgi:prepilin-type N-terminal cleavage/methylation domain-containing protein
VVKFVACSLGINYKKQKNKEDELMIRKENGFTLIELLIVIAVIGILAAFAVPAFQQRVDQAASTTCIGNLSIIESGQMQYLADNPSQKITDITDTTVLVPTYMKRDVKCKKGGTYTTTTDPPTCNYSDAKFPHKLP